MQRGRNCIKEVAPTGWSKSVTIVSKSWSIELYVFVGGRDRGLSRRDLRMLLQGVSNPLPDLKWRIYWTKNLLVDTSLLRFILLQEA